jgi:hypothetical protein
MRHTISGMIAALAVVTAGIAPASACGLFDCGLGYAAPVYSGCGVCGGGSYAAYERLPDPTYQYRAQPYSAQQYYFVDQGPTYSGPGDFAPYPSYREGGWGAYRHRPHYYGYNGYHSHAHVRPWHVHNGYHYWGHTAPHSIRYGYHGMPHHYGYRGYPQRRYY